MLSLLPIPRVSVKWLNNHLIPLNHSASSWSPCKEGREVWICGTIQQQKYFFSLQSLPKLAMRKSLNLWYSRVTSVQSCSYTATQMSSYSYPGTGDFGSMPSLEKKKKSFNQKKAVRILGAEMLYRGTLHGGVSCICLTAQGRDCHWASALTPPSYGAADLYVPKQSHR